MVWPLFGSGAPLAVLTLAIFFRKKRPTPVSFGMVLVAVAWVVGPLTIDTMFLMQRGYRGSIPLHEVAVIGTCYQFFVDTIGIGLFFSVCLLPIVVVAGLMVIIRSSEKLLSASVVLSLLALDVQAMNWGIFIWD